MADPRWPGVRCELYAQILGRRCRTDHSDPDVVHNLDASDRRRLERFDLCGTFLQAAILRLPCIPGLSPAWLPVREGGLQLQCR